MQCPGHCETPREYLSLKVLQYSMRKTVVCGERRIRRQKRKMRRGLRTPDSKWAVQKAEEPSGDSVLMRGGGPDDVHGGRLRLQALV